MPWREKTDARKKTALHQRRGSTPTLRLLQVQLGCGYPDRGRLHAVGGCRGCYLYHCLYHDRDQHRLAREESRWLRLKRRPYEYG